MEKNKVILISVLSVLVVGGIIFAIVKNKKGDTNNTSTSSTENPKNDEDTEEETSDEEADHIHDEDEDEDESEADFDFKEVEGEYEGSVKYTSANFTANQGADSATVVVKFSESNTSSSYTRWTMTVKVDKEWLKNNSSSNILRLSYSDCVCEDIEAGREKVPKRVYSKGKGYFDIDGDVIRWNDGATKEGDILNGCEFKKM